MTKVLEIKLAAAGILLLNLTAIACLADSAPVTFKQGLNYIPVMPAQPVSVNPGQIEVLEFFWYGDARCFALEPDLESWSKNKAADVVLEWVPAALNPQWDLAARAFYTAQQLKIGAQANAAIYAAIHVNHLNLATEADYQKLFTGQLGIEAAQFQNAWNSSAVNQQISQAKVLAQRYGIDKVPVFTVNGKWLTGAGFHLKDAQIMDAVNWLVQHEQTMLPASAP